MVTLSSSVLKTAGSALLTVAEAGYAVYCGAALASPGTRTTTLHDENDSPASLKASHVYTPGRSNGIGNELQT